MHHTDFDMAIKRALDFILACVALLFLAPVMVIVAVLLWFTTRGPILYRGIRVGRNGQAFRILKFRTMVSNAEELGNSITPGDDPRITGVGYWLRRFKLDELPQFLNVLKGDMSLVGPRPEVPEYVNRLSHSQQQQILSVRPGITDWASIWNADEGTALWGLDDPTAAYETYIWPTKVLLQQYYVRTRSVSVDLRLLLYTLLALMFREWLPQELVRLGLSRNICCSRKGTQACRSAEQDALY